MEAKTQRDTRTYIDAVDQHGRPWGYEAERKTMHPTCQMFQCGWTDPLNTPQKYIEVPVGKGGRPKYGELRINWDQWIADQREATRQRINTAYQLATDFYGNAVGQMDFMKDPKVLREAGPPPWPSVEALESARDGMLALLGYDGETGKRVELDAAGGALIARFVMPSMDTHAAQKAQPVTAAAVGSSKAAPEVPNTYPAFVAWAMEKGKMSWAQAREAWKEHSASLKLVEV